MVDIVCQDGRKDDYGDYAYANLMIIYITNKALLIKKINCDIFAIVLRTWYHLTVNWRVQEQTQSWCCLGGSNDNIHHE